MSHNRNLDYLIKRRIIYRRSPITDRPTESFDWVITMKMVHMNAMNYFVAKLR